MTISVPNWIRDKITPLFEEIKLIKKDSLPISTGDIWSLKKEVFLHLYIPSYYNIVKNHFEKWYYYDPFCGSGMFEFTKPSILKGERFPGTPIVTLSQRSKYPFEKYFLSDKHGPFVNALKNRIKKLYKLDVEIKEQDFQTSIGAVEGIDAQTGKESCLAVIDPVGYSPIPWEDMERLFKIPTCDLFIIAMTSDLHRNLSIALNPKHKGDNGLTAFLGNASWQQCKTGDDIVKLYAKQINKFEKNVLTLSVNRVGETKIYDIIMATRSRGGFKAMLWIAEKLQEVTTENLTPQAIFGSGRMKPIDEWFTNDK